ncbi:MAG: hypothetical protein PVJ30_07160, partial [Thiohalocapsa sp.]
MSLMQILFVLLGCAWATLAGGAEEAAGDARRYSFGVVPQQSASKLARSWSPLLQRLGERAG